MRIRSLAETRIRTISNKTKYPRLTELFLKILRTDSYIHHTFEELHQGILTDVQRSKVDDVAKLFDGIYDWIDQHEKYTAIYKFLAKPLRIYKHKGRKIEDEL